MLTNSSTFYMKNTPHIGILTNLGLTENEARVYIAALSTGPATILRIAQTAEIKRTTVYSVIETLKMKGLITIHFKGFKKLFVAENPEKLESILEARKALLAKALPEFAALYNLKGNESTIKFYEGLEGVKTAYEGLLHDVKPKENYSIISNIEPWLSHDPKFFLDFTKRRAKLNINIRLLLQDSPTARAHRRLQKTFNETIKILPAGTTIVSNLVIIPKKIVLHQLHPPVMAVVIENQSIVCLHQEMFEIMWRSIKN